MSKLRKVVSTEMNDKSVIINVVVWSPVEDSSSFTCSHDFSFEFPFEVVNPRIALQIATLLVSDPTIPQSDEKEKN